MDSTYLPFTGEQLNEHFIGVRGAAQDGRYLKHYEDSIKQAQEYDELLRRGTKPTPQQTRQGRQIEKDERFWVAAALMALYHSADSSPGELFGSLLQRAGLQPPSAFLHWKDALAGRLDLFFEVSLPSPRGYKAWLREHLGERVPIPYLREQADARGVRLEGPTHADAVLLARRTGVAVIFEAKVLSDVSTDITFDLARNQLARTIDVMLEPPGRRVPLNERNPEQTFLVLVTPEIVRGGTAQNAISRSRLYGWLMPAYMDPGNSLLSQHLPHRDRQQLAEAASRIGWASWEDCNAVEPKACSWLDR